MVTLIDTGYHSDECWDALISALAVSGFSLDDIDRIILTHSHPDHIGLANRIAMLRGIPVYVHHEALYRLRQDADFLEMRVEFFHELYQSMGCGVEGVHQVQKLRESISANKQQRVEGEIVTLNDGNIIAGLEVIATPGHSPDHIVLRHPRQRWLFLGDLLILHMTSNALIEPDRAGRRLPTLIQYIDSLDKILDLDVDIAYSGHGQPIQQFRNLSLTRLQGIYKRADKICRYVANGLSIPKDIALAYYKELYRHEFTFVMSEVIGYLDYLELNGKLRKERINGIWHYTVTT